MPVPPGRYYLSHIDGTELSKRASITVHAIVVSDGYTPSFFVYESEDGRFGEAKIVDLVREPAPERQGDDSSEREDSEFNAT
jgi:hypothetical protein